MVLLNRFKSIIKHHLKQGDSLVLAVSGGPDSVCLLDLMNRVKLGLDLRLVVAHFNHCLRGRESDKDEALVKKLAKDYSLEFVCQSAKADEIKSENDARILRLKFLRQVVKTYQADWLSTAHQADDQIETFWLHLLRGAGIRGLAGMKIVEDKGGFSLFRPLLGFAKEDILAYNQKQQLVFSQDQTNFEPKFSRNRLRLELVPYIKKYFQPNLTQVNLRQTDYFQKLSDWLESVLKEKGQKCLAYQRGRELALDRGCLKQEPPFLQSEIVLWAISKVVGSRQDFYQAQIKEILKLKGEKRFGRLKFKVGKDRLIIYK